MSREGRVYCGQPKSRLSAPAPVKSRHEQIATSTLQRAVNKVPPRDGPSSTVMRSGSAWLIAHPLGHPLPSGMGGRVPHWIALQRVDLLKNHFESSFQLHLGSRLSLCLSKVRIICDCAAVVIGCLLQQFDHLKSLDGHTLILRLSNLIAVSAARLLRGAFVPEYGPRRVDLSPKQPVSWQVQCSDIPDRGGWQNVDRNCCRQRFP